jgi:hypothetical protein
MTLPSDLFIDNLLLIQIPDDITLKEAKRSLEAGKAVKALIRITKKPVQIRFLLPDGKEAPPFMSLGRFRELVKEGATISIDEGRGGIPVEPTKPKVLS